MIKVLHIVLGLQVGGLERFLMVLIRNMSSDIFPQILCLQEKGLLGASFDKTPIHELRKRPEIQISCIARVTDFVRQNKIDIIHTHNPSPHFYGALAGFLSGVPVVHTKHGRNYPSQRKKIILNRVASYFTKIVVPVSMDAADVCLKIERIDSRKVYPIINGIDLRDFQSRKKQRVLLQKLGVPDASKIIGIVARLSPEKDHATLLHACKSLADYGYNFRLIVIGDGPMRASLIDLSKKLGIKDIVIFAGIRQDISELLSELDVFVLSSTTEGLSMTLLEAMASSLPVVATNVGGNPEVVLESKTGFLVPPRTPQAISEKIRILLDDMELAHAMGRAGRERVLNHFNIESTARKYEEIYRKLVICQRKTMHA